jgi:uncharacterized protein YaaW (UPF0174 family)
MEIMIDPALQFAYEDKILYDVLSNANEDETKEFEELLRQKTFCELPDKVTPCHLAAEFQRMGGHSWKNIPRGHGPSYRHILNEVGKRFLSSESKKRFDNVSEAADKETILLEDLYKKALSKMSAKDRAELKLKLKQVAEKAKKQGLRSAGTTISGMLAVPVLRVMLARLVVSAILKKLTVNMTLRTVGTRLVGLANPITLAISTALLAHGLSGPAFSVTVPGVLMIAAMRARQDAEDCVERLRKAAARADEKISEVDNE